MTGEAGAVPGWAERAATRIPGGSSTGSKRPAALFGSRAGAPGLPTHLVRASGCHVVDTAGRRYLDLGMALGAVGIGYADRAVTRAVCEAAAEGPVGSLPHTLEVEVAERLAEVLPCAEQVRFLRTGAEATAAAVRLARTLTGRTRLVACGYFGWLDWCGDAEGVPAADRAAVRWVPFNDVGALERAVADGPAPAAIVLEPLVHDVADAAWLAAARRLADGAGALLVFDEVKTAFRVRTGGVQALHGVVPDLATVGKALANGYPLAAVVGRRGAMEAARRTWISSTAAAEATGLAAARAVLDWHARAPVPARMAAVGARLREVTAVLLARHPGLGVRAVGPDVMWRLEADRPEALDHLVAEAARAGVLLKRGAYQFAALAHEEAAEEELAVALAAAVPAAEAALVAALADAPVPAAPDP
jgi:glutamate-1-semialdehyde 2,1-aminomutase